MLGKVDVRDILADHLGTLVSTDGKHRSVGDFILFFVVPLVVAIGLVVAGVCLNDTATSLLITALSIFAGLLLNLLVLIHGLIRRYRDEQRFKDARRVLHELYANLAYGVLICVVGICPLIVLGFGLQGRGRAVVSGLAFFLTGNFLLTLLMILKRVHVLLNHEFKYPAKH